MATPPAHQGLSYGAQFQAMANISVDPIEYVASTSIYNDKIATVCRYTLSYDVWLGSKTTID